MPILNWLNKDQAVTIAQKTTYRLLEEVPDLSCGDLASGNLLIQGDNLEALKALLPFYAGLVKCIFIDPPYNTKSAFEHYDDNLEHSKWLSLMYPRLELLRELLSEDGSIWITIDDHEAHYLKVVCDEIFGRRNAALDMGHHLIRREKLGIPQSARDVFALLAQAGWISHELADGLKRMVGFRNIAVHDYQALHLLIVISIITGHLDEFLDYSRALLTHLPADLNAPDQA